MSRDDGWVEARLARNWRRPFVALGAALVAAFVGALVTRAGMRAVALIAGTPTDFSLEGTASIFLFYVLTLAPGVIALSLSRRWWSTLIFVAGVALLLYGAVNIGAQEVAVRDKTPANVISLSLVLLVMAAAYAAQVGFLWKAAERIRGGGRQ
jgi:hypothetical protein